MAHTGMFVAPLAGSPPVGMSPTDGRLVMGALYGTTAQPVQGGVVTLSASVMQATVSQAVWQLPDPTNAAATFFSPTDAITLTFGAAPGSGGRIDAIAVKQNNVENADADSRVNVIVIAGTPSGSPVAPTMPSGYFRVGNLLINAGITNMAASTATGFSAQRFAPPDLVAPTQAALGATSGALGQVASVTADTAANNGLFMWNGSNWIPAAVASQIGAFTPTGIYSAGANTPQVARTGNRVFFEGSIASTSATFVGGTTYTLGSIPAAYAPSATRAFVVTVNGTFGTLSVASSGTVTLVPGTGFTGVLTMVADNASWRI